MNLDPHVLVPLATTHFGSGARRLLLIHGLGDGAFVWRPLLRQLPPGLAGLCVDLRGHGDSPHDPLQRYQAPAFTLDVVALIDRWDLSDLTIIGHSLGADVAIRIATLRSGRVHKLVLIDGGPELEAKATLAAGQQIGAMPLMYSSIDALEVLLAERHPFAEPDVIREYTTGSLRKLGPNTYALKADPALLKSPPQADVAAVWAALENAACPKLLVRGAASAVLTRGNALYVSQRARNCRLEVVPRAGHAVAVDNPRGLWDAMMPFVMASPGTASA